jgi:hypothetical protein
MRLVFPQTSEETARIAEWVGNRLGVIISPPYVAIGMTDDDRLYCGGVIFNSWNGANIEITVAMDRGPTRGVIRALQHYVFVQSKATRVTAHTKRSNKKVRKLLPRLGFKYEFTRERYYGPSRADDAFAFVLFPENVRKF